MLTDAILKQIAPNARQDIVDALIAQEPVLIATYAINSARRLAHFLAQTAHESGGFRTIVENLNYSVQALTSLFGTARISAGQAAQFGRNDAIHQPANQQAIANTIYGGTWGARNLGNTDAGDGWTFRGRGLIQVTGRSNYAAFAKSLSKTLDEAVNELETPAGAVISAGWFWDAHKLNPIADTDNITNVTHPINAGLAGLADRQRYLDAAKAALAGQAGA